MTVARERILDLVRGEGKLCRPSKQDVELEELLDALGRAAESDNLDGLAARETKEAIDRCVRPASAMDEKSAPQPVAASPVHAEPELYSFPGAKAAECDFGRLSDAELNDALKSLTVRPPRSDARRAYGEIRDEHCAISVLMNERGVTPPRLRCQRSLPRRSQEARDDETLMMRDRQVIDMHWLHCRGKRDELPKGDFADLFLGDEFDFDLASQLAEKPWKAEVKTAKVLNLIPHEQLQMACLRTKAVADLWRNTENSMQTTIDKRLREQAVFEPSLRPHIEDLKLLWLADKLVGKDGLVAVGQMHGWLTGQKPLAISTLSIKLKRMRRRTLPRASER